MEDGLYHRDVWMPFTLGFATLLKYSRHALTEAARDRYGSLNLPATIGTHEAEVIEVEIVNGKPHKALLRKAYDAHRDICLVVLLDTSVVKTVWCNLRTDAHKTLDRSKYVEA
jgi:hypothetical protein